MVFNGVFTHIVVFAVLIYGLVHEQDVKEIHQDFIVKLMKKIYQIAKLVYYNAPKHLGWIFSNTTFVREGYVGGFEAPDLKVLNAPIEVLWGSRPVGIAYRTSNNIILPLHVLDMQDGFSREHLVNVRYRWNDIITEARVKTIIDFETPNKTMDGWVVTETPQALSQVKNLKNHGDPTKVKLGYLWTIRDGEKHLIPVRIVWNPHITYHDASTMAGDSGAPITDATGKVLTTHHAYATANKANVGVAPPDTETVNKIDNIVQNMHTQLSDQSSVIEEYERRFMEMNAELMKLNQKLGEVTPSTSQRQPDEIITEKEGKKRQRYVPKRKGKGKERKEPKKIWSDQKYEELMKNFTSEQIRSLARKYREEYADMYGDDSDDLQREGNYEWLDQEEEQEMYEDFKDMLAQDFHSVSQ
jgi:hypothetical protein